MIRGVLGSEDQKHGAGAETRGLALETHKDIVGMFNWEICLGEHYLNYARSKSL